ncbi:hypothetical protein BH09MYX1_BH09MYX1_53300 [soil metagenome]
MKIACQSCQAKYTIADEKVLGKIVKIRCKKCGATIVINGNEQEGATQAFDAGAQPQAGGVYDYTAGGGGESWTVNVSDGDQRTMTTPEIIEAYRGGVVNDDTYCWKDGMGDWLPLREVPELASSLAAGPQPSMHAHQSEAPPAQHDDQPTQAGFSSLFGGQGGGQDAGASLFGGGAAAPAAAGSAPSAARRAGGRAGGADLFGTAATAGSEQDAMAGGGEAAGGGAGSMTGQRNENSVLFSLSALTANAPKEEAPMAQGEGSGLIDIRALSSNMAAANNGPKRVDDIMNLGGGGAFSAALAAPVLAPPPADVADLSIAQGQGEKKGNTGLILAMVGGLLVFGLIIAGAIVYVMKPGTTTTTTTTGTTNGTTTTPTDTATGATTAPTGTTTVAVNDTATAPTGTGAKPTTTATGGGGSHPATTSTGGGTVATATATAAAGSGKCGCAANDFNCQMACSAGVKPTATATATAAGGSAPFDKGAALSSLSGIASSLSSCKKPDGPTGSGKVTVTFEPSGAVSKVEFIEGPFGGTAGGGCIAGKFRGAHIPAFSGGAVPANKSFVLN